MSRKIYKKYQVKNQRLADAIRQGREETGKKSWQFAQDFGISPGVFSTWESGRVEPPIDESINMLRALASILPEVRMRIGALIDSLRGDPTGQAGRAFTALDVILRNGKPEEQTKVIAYLEKIAAEVKK